jgi:hypothetical protein
MLMILMVEWKVKMYVERDIYLERERWIEQKERGRERGMERERERGEEG